LTLVNIGLILDVLIKLSSHRLTSKQKAILREVVNTKLTTTSLINSLSRKLECSKSALWNNLRELVSCNLIISRRGEPCELTDIGLLIIKGGDVLCLR
jgi:predicted transcriptional regulator